MSKAKTIQVCVGIGIDQLTPEYVTIEIPKTVSRPMTDEERIQWVMKNTDVEMENLYIVEEVHKPTTPTIITTMKYADETVVIYE
jgi:desulfoferrodoxin (superoxide reductase-like protein)